MAQEYNVHYNTISDINRCLTWNWLHAYKNNIRLEAQGSLSHGELNGCNVISEDTAKNIIKDIESSSDPLAAIARKYNVKTSLIYDINRCKTWKHLHNYKKNIRNEYKDKEAMKK